jgi:hypothetical protein
MIAALGILILLAWWYTAVSQSFIVWFPYPSAAKWTLGTLGVLIIVVGTLASPGNCSTDWDGVSNPTVCD